MPRDCAHGDGVPVRVAVQVTDRDCGADGGGVSERVVLTPRVRLGVVLAENEPNRALTEDVDGGGVHGSVSCGACVAEAVALTRMGGVLVELGLLVRVGDRDDVVDRLVLLAEADADADGDVDNEVDSWDDGVGVRPVGVPQSHCSAATKLTPDQSKRYGDPEPAGGATRPRMNWNSNPSESLPVTTLLPWLPTLPPPPPLLRAASR